MTTTPLRPELDLFLLGGRPADPALVAGDRVVTYGELVGLVADEVARLGTTPRLVLLEARNDVATVVTYLAALAGHHPVLLVGEGDASRQAELVATYFPDGPDVPPAGEALHPDLALLLSTSGSTGSPKLVRLSRANVAANALSIATYLGIRPTDRAMTSLPLHYCYGLSVLNSHLLAGAAVVLTDLSVADACFWELAGRAGATSLAGVPYTFELLAASGFADRELPTLRYLTQAGGRMAPERVREFAELGRRKGFDLYVMYGATEATARMAYLPPDLARTRPTAIGVPVPGGSFRLEPVPGLEDPSVGELVYAGPNVMMGYAQGPTDLARGRELTELRTGDLARQADDGLWEVTGRLNRHAKVFGLRLDLDRLESQLGGAVLLAVGDVLHAFVDRPRMTGRTAERLRALTGLPHAAVRVHRVDAVPHTPSGKVDTAALRRHVEALAAAQRPDDGPATPEALRDLYAALLGRPDATVEDSFVSLGGDSLSFVELSTRLGRRLGSLPEGWQHRSIASLAGSAGPRRRLVAPLDVTVLLRALAIVLIVVTHTDLVLVPGGAHLLLAVAGFNLARFVLPVTGRLARVRRLLTTTAAVAVPSALWIGGCALLGRYEPATALLLNGALGSDRWSEDWHFWFLEALVWANVGLAGLLAVPLLDRLQRRHRFGAALAAVAATSALRFGWTGVEAGATERYTVGLVLWCLALGWAAAEALGSTWRRLAVSGLAVVTAYGFFGDPLREAVVVAGVLALLWVRQLLLPRAVTALCGLLAGASLWIYLTHWQVYPDLEAAGRPVLAIVASLVVGVAAWWLYERAARALRIVGWSRAERAPSARDRHRTRPMGAAAA